MFCCYNVVVFVQNVGSYQDDRVGIDETQHYRPVSILNVFNVTSLVELILNPNLMLNVS